MLRIIAGKLKGRKLSKPKVQTIRPTKDMVKEALFSILYDAVSGSRFLDLYAGSGSMGLEAISRGAGEVVFCDNSRWAEKSIEENIAKLGITESCRFVKMEVLRAISSGILGLTPYNIIFMDPPYKDDLTKKTLNAIYDYDMIAPQGLVISEHYLEENLPAKVGSLSLLSERRYGNTGLSIFRHEP